MQGIVARDSCKGLMQWIARDSKGQQGIYARDCCKERGGCLTISWAGIPFNPFDTCFHIPDRNKESDKQSAGQLDCSKLYQSSPLQLDSWMQCDAFSPLLIVLIGDQLCWEMERSSFGKMKRLSD